MRFLSPTTDIAFKKLFASQERADLTISFLNSVLERREGELITQVQINDTANKPITKDLERTFVDVHCTDQKGQKYIIEVQVEDERNFMERAQFYASFFLTRQLEKRTPYADLVPVIFVGVLDFSLFKDNQDYLSHHLIMNNKTGIRTLRHLEWHFVELKKFTKTLEELETQLEKWTYLLKHAHEMSQVPATMKTDQELVTAFDVLEQHHWTEADLQKYYAELDIWRCAVDLERGARKEGREKGLEEVVRNMLVDGLSIEKIAAYTGLTIEHIQKLKKD
ncbi:Rpn family recombination-promoting nuclease/putative transposase [bacterium]|nr:MAG: Rpn family recombination-promoting nuclease/putative transposase [bacterium]